MTPAPLSSPPSAGVMEQFWGVPAGVVQGSSGAFAGEQGKVSRSIPAGESSHLGAEEKMLLANPAAFDISQRNKRARAVLLLY